MTGIDHLVLAVSDLDAARERYAALGFTLTPEARHPFGTGNSLVQLDGSFLELVAVKSIPDIPEHGPDNFSFAAFNRDFLRRGEGFSMLVLEASDALADVARFRAAGLATYDPFDFSRKARLPSGEDVTVGFSLAFVSHPGMPDAGFFTCRQHNPRHFWKPEYQVHANTARVVRDVWLVADRPLEFAEFLQAFANADDVVASDEQLRIETPRGSIVAATPSAFEAWFGVPPSARHRRPCFAAYTLTVRDLAEVERRVKQAGADAIRKDALLVVQELCGTTVAFGEG